MNEWNVLNGSQRDYQDFGRAQLEVYNAASFGWAYWTLKNDRKHWDFEWNVQNNYLELGNFLGFPIILFWKKVHTRAQSEQSLAYLCYFSSYWFSPPQSSRQLLVYLLWRMSRLWVYFEL